MAAYRNKLVIERLEANKVKPWTIYKEDAYGHKRPLPGMTLARFNRLEKWLNKPRANVGRYKNSGLNLIV